MKTFLARTLSVVLYVYFIGLMWSLPYFNWRYAKEHGFLEWIAFGEIVPSGKAVVWPYFVVRGWVGKTNENQNPSDVHYWKSKQVCEAALTVIVERRGPSYLSPKEKEDVVSLLVAAMREAKMVREDYLLSVHPELPTRYRDGYISGVEALIDGMKNDDRVKVATGISLFNEFSEWIDATKQDLRFP